MRKTAWVWFAGCAAWTVDGIIGLHLHALPHAMLALLVACMFLIAGMYYRQQ